MSRPPLEVADLIRTAGAAFLERNRHWLSWKHVQVLRAVARCRTAALGGHLDECTRCGYRAISYNSCRNRHCPKCQTAARERWIAGRRRELLPTRYVHVVHASSGAGATGLAEQEGPLRSPVSRQCGDASRSRPRSPTPRRRDRLLQRSAYLESETRTPPACTLRSSRRRTVFRPQALDQVTPRILSSRQGARACFSRQVCCGPQACLPGWPTRFPWRTATACPTEDLCRLVKAAVPKRLGGLFQTALWRPRVCAPVSGSVHPSRGHLQPSPAFLCRWPSHLPLAKESRRWLEMATR